MAVTWTDLSALKRTSSTDASTYQSNSDTFPSGKLIIIGVSNDDDADPTAPTPTLASDSPVTVTWTQIATVPFDTIASPTKRLTLFRGVGDGQTGTVTATLSEAGTGCNIFGMYGTNVDTTTNQGVVQSATGSSNSSTSATATLATFGQTANNSAVIAVATNGSGSLSPESGWGEITPDLTHGTPTHRNAMAARTGQDLSPSYTIGSAAAWGCIAVEVKDLATSTGFPLEPPDIATTATVIADPDPNAVWNPTLNNSIDYVLSPDPARTRPIYIQGGRNVVIGATVSGGQFSFYPWTITMSATGQGAFLRIADDGGTTDRVIYVKGANFYGNGYEIDGFKTRGPTTNNRAEYTTLKIHDCFVSGLTGSTPDPHVHADVVQLAGGIGELWIENFTGYSNYAGLQLQQEGDVSGTAKNISGITRSGSTVTVTTSTAHGLVANDFVGLWNITPSTYEGGYEVATAPTTTTFTYNIDNDTPATPATAVGNCIKLVFSYTVGDLHFKRVNIVGEDNPSGNPSETLNGIRFAARSAPNDTGTGYTREREDQTNITVEGWTGTAEFEDFYVDPYTGDGSDFIKPPATASTYTVCQGTLAGSQISFPAAWTAVTGTIKIGTPPGGDFVYPEIATNNLTAALTGTGTLTATGQAVAGDASAALTGTGSLSASIQSVKFPTAALGGAGTLSAAVEASQGTTPTSPGRPRGPRKPKVNVRYGHALRREDF